MKLHLLPSSFMLLAFTTICTAEVYDPTVAHANLAVADPTGAQDSRRAIQDRLDLCNSPDDVVVLPPGNYKINFPNPVPAGHGCLQIKHGTLRGAGPEETKLFYADTVKHNQSFISNNWSNSSGTGGASGITIEGLSLDGNHFLGTACYITGGDTIRLHNLTLREYGNFTSDSSDNPPSGIRIRNWQSTGPVTNVTITNSSIIDIHGMTNNAYGVSIKGNQHSDAGNASAIIIANLKVSNVRSFSSSYSATGISLLGVEDYSVTHCAIEAIGNPTGISTSSSIDGIYLMQSHDGSIINNTASNIAGLNGMGIRANDCDKLIITNNKTFNTGRNGLLLRDCATFTVVANDFQKTGQYSGNHPGVEIQHSENGVLEDNVVDRWISVVWDPMVTNPGLSNYKARLDQGLPVHGIAIRRNEVGMPYGSYPPATDAATIGIELQGRFMVATENKLGEHAAPGFSLEGTVNNGSDPNNLGDFLRYFVLSGNRIFGSGMLSPGVPSWKVVGIRSNGNVSHGLLYNNEIENINGGPGIQIDYAGKLTFESNRIRNCLHGMYFQPSLVNTNWNDSSNIANYGGPVFSNFAFTGNNLITNSIASAIVAMPYASDSSSSNYKVSYENRIPTTSTIIGDLLAKESSLKSGAYARIQTWSSPAASENLDLALGNPVFQSRFTVAPYSTLPTEGHADFSRIWWGSGNVVINNRTVAPTESLTQRWGNKTSWNAVPQSTPVGITNSIRDHDSLASKFIFTAASPYGAPGTPLNFSIVSAVGAQAVTNYSVLLDFGDGAPVFIGPPSGTPGGNISFTYSRTGHFTPYAVIYVDSSEDYNSGIPIRVPLTRAVGTMRYPTGVSIY